MNIAARARRPPEFLVSVSSPSQPEIEQHSYTLFQQSSEVVFLNTRSQWSPAVPIQGDAPGDMPEAGCAGSGYHTKIVSLRTPVGANPDHAANLSHILAGG
jgi:hypothetical protein